MNDSITILDYSGCYGGAASRDTLTRALKEALALVEQAPAGTQFVCPGLRIDLVDPGAEGARPAALD